MDEEVKLSDVIEMWMKEIVEDYEGFDVGSHNDGWMIDIYDHERELVVRVMVEGIFNRISHVYFYENREDKSGRSRTTHEEFLLPLEDPKTLVKLEIMIRDHLVGWQNG